MADEKKHFVAHLKGVAVKTIFPDKRSSIISVPSTATIAEVYEILTKNKVLSVPVLDKSLAKPRYTAFVDVIDILVHVLSNLSPGDVIGSEAPELFHKFTAGQIVGLSKRNRFHPVEESAPLMVALELMVKWQVHRIPVVDQGGALETLVTQSQIIKYIHDNMYLLKKIKNKTVEELGLGTSPVVTVNSSTSVLEGFKVMGDKNVTAVGVVDDHGNLVGNLSASDIKTVGYTSDFLGRMFVPLSDFLKALCSDKYSKGNVVTFEGRHTFEEIINTLVEKQIHRVYIVDDQGRPLRVITLTDILTNLFTF